jgi:hypothetical protein
MRSALNLFADSRGIGFQPVDKRFPQAGSLCHERITDSELSYKSFIRQEGEQL